MKRTWVPYRSFGSLSPHLNVERGVEGKGGGCAETYEAADNNDTIRHTPTPLSHLPHTPSQAEIGDWIKWYHYLSISESLLPFPNEDNYLEFEPGQSSAGVWDAARLCNPIRQ